jgi:hypothetical protein
MGSADTGFKTFFAQLASPQSLTQVIAIVSAVLLALAGGQAVRNWHRRHADP